MISHKYKIILSFLLFNIIFLFGNNLYIPEYYSSLFTVPSHFSSQLFLSESQKTTLTSRTKLNYIYFQRDTSTTIHNHFNWTNQESYTTRIKINNYSFNLRSGLGTNQKHFEYYTEPSRFKFITKNYYSFLELIFPLFNNTIALQTGLGTKQFTNDKTKLSNKFGLIINPSQNLSLKLARAKDNSSSYLSWKYPDSSHKVIFPRQYTHYDFDLSFKFLKHFQLKASKKISITQPGKKVEYSSLNLRQKGKSHQDNYEITLDLGNPLLKTEYFRYDHSSQADFYSNEHQFGSINNIELKHRKIKLKLIYKYKSQQFTSWLNLGKIDFKTSGHIESWPITSAWIDLLGLRSNVDLDYSLDFGRLGLKYNHNYQSNSVNLGLIYESLFPTGQTKTWQPVIFNIGVQNLQINELPIIRQDGIYCHLGWKKTLTNSLKMKIKLNQYFPVFSKFHKKQKTEQKEFSTFRFGGSTHSLDLIYTF